MNNQQLAIQQFSYTYVKANSLYQNRVQGSLNSIDFTITEKGSSQKNSIGIGKIPSEIVQIEMQKLFLPKKINELTGDKASSLIFNRLYMLVSQFDQEYFSSPDGFKYHFELQVSENPQDESQYIATPVNTKFSFPTPMRFYSQLTFQFYTYKPYEFEQDQYECYIDYSKPFIELQRVSGEPHNLTNFDIVSIQNFDVPSVLSQDSQNASTYRSNFYRINVKSSTVLELPIVINPQIANSINRPADKLLGSYRPNTVCQVVPSLSPTVINTPIQHGLVDGDIISIISVSSSLVSSMITTFGVSIISATSFSIQYNSAVALAPFTCTVLEFPRISPDRKNTVYLNIQSKRVELQMTVRSHCKSSNNSIISVS